MKLFFYFLVIPGMMIGWLVGTIFIGVVPTLMGDTFIQGFHYTSMAHKWVRISGGVGMFIGFIFTSFMVYLNDF